MDFGVRFAQTDNFPFAAGEKRYFLAMGNGAKFQELSSLFNLKNVNICIRLIIFSLLTISK